MKTDKAWERFGQKDPYFGVLADPKYHQNKLDDAARTEFFLSGKNHIQYIMNEVNSGLGKEFNPSTGLDFGCGVGRVLIPMSEFLTEAVGFDISIGMLEEAQDNCLEHNRTNVTLLTSDKAPQLNRKFDFIHSYIVFRHIPPARGNPI